MKKLTIALAQIDLAIGEPDRNCDRVRSCAEQAHARQADLLVLPELWSTASDLEHAASYATSTDKGMFEEVAAIAREHRVAIAGSLLESNNGRIYNTATLVDANGTLLGVYRKLHLVPMLDEDKYLSGGSEAPILDTALGKCALAVCYDVRFPELWRHYALEGARLVIMPAEFPIQRIEHWRALVPARAIENQYFIAATNRIGTSNNETFGGHSMIVDPWGEKLVEGGAEEQLLVAQIDLDQVQQVRERVPALRDRRPDVYARW